MGKEEFQKELAQLEDLYEQTTGEKNGEVLPPAPGQIQRQQSAACKGAWVSDDFLEPCLCGLEAGGTADSRRGDVKAVKRVHPGAIVLLHNTSRTNGEILDEVLTKWEEMGYHFASLEELVSSGGREARSFFLDG